jgi:acetyl-CoA carboxylase carboxyltransferase component
MRHSARLLMALANATTPILTVVLRKGYGLGHYIMGSQSLEPMLLLSWPGAEFGGMGLEGAVKIIHKHALQAEQDPAKRAELQAKLTAELREANTAFDMARRFLIDDVVDPADTRRLLAQTLSAWQKPLRKERKRIIDSF